MLRSCSHCRNDSFLKGDTNVGYLQENSVRIWNEWADEKGELGPIYGHQWRSWGAADGRQIDQISEVIEQIKTNPNSRRLIVSASCHVQLAIFFKLMAAKVSIASMGGACCHNEY